MTRDSFRGGAPLKLGWQSCFFHQWCGPFIDCVELLENVPEVISEGLNVPGGACPQTPLA